MDGEPFSCTGSSTPSISISLLLVATKADPLMLVSDAETTSVNWEKALLAVGADAW